MINLTKGQTINLSKEGGGGLDKIALGTGWGKKAGGGGFFGFGGGGDVDLDASCVMLDENNNVTDQVWFSQLRSKCGSILHTGDDTGGGGNADKPNEIINVDLNKVPSNVKTLVFTVNCFAGTNGFKGVPNSFSCLIDLSSNKEIARYNLETEGGNYSAIILSKVYRHNGEWKFKAIGATSSGRTIKDIIPDVKRNV